MYAKSVKAPRQRIRITAWRIIVMTISWWNRVLSQRVSHKWLASMRIRSIFLNTHPVSEVPAAAGFPMTSKLHAPAMIFVSGSEDK